MRNTPTMMMAQAHIEDLHREAREHALAAQARRARAEQQSEGLEVRAGDQPSWVRRVVTRIAVATPRPARNI